MVLVRMGGGGSSYRNLRYLHLAVKPAVAVAVQQIFCVNPPQQPAQPPQVVERVVYVDQNGNQINPQNRQRKVVAHAQQSEDARAQLMNDDENNVNEGGKTIN